MTVHISLPLFFLVIFLMTCAGYYLAHVLERSARADKDRTVFLTLLKGFTRVHIERQDIIGSRFRVCLFALMPVGDVYTREIKVAATAWHDSLEEALLTAFRTADERRRADVDDD